MALNELTIVVTRPKEQASKLLQLLENQGAHTISLPTLLIKPIDTDQSKLASNFDKIIFISTNAVRYGVPQLTGIQSHHHCFAIGNVTAQAMQMAGLMVQAVPELHNSEGLLALAALEHVHHQKILIMRRAQGGRETLAQTLTARGAKVHYMEVYTCSCPASDVTALSTMTVDWFICTSQQSLKNLYTMLQTHALAVLGQAKILVPSDRVASTGYTLGLTQLYVADSADDQGMLNALMKLEGSP